MLANGGQRALGSGPLPPELVRDGRGSGSGRGSGGGRGSERGSGSGSGSQLHPEEAGVISVDAAPYFLEDEDRYLFHAAYKVSGKWCVVNR